MHKNLEALIAGENLIFTDENNEDNTLEFASINVRVIKGPLLDRELRFSDLEEIENEMRIYVDPKDEEIARLKAIVDRQSAEIEKLVAPKGYGETRRPRLSADIVKEIEDAIAKGVHQKLILSTYDISGTTYSRILNHKHSLSTKRVSVK